MKKELHPQYHPVVFVDMTTGKRFISRSTKTSEKKEVIDGEEHSVISIGITSDSHPFFTGLAQFVDTEGRIDKFQKKFGMDAASAVRERHARKGKKDEEAAPAAKVESVQAD